MCSLIHPLEIATSPQIHECTYLADHDGCTFFDKFSDLVRTGPTSTNVNDTRALLIFPEDGLPFALKGRNQSVES